MRSALLACLLSLAVADGGINARLYACNPASPTQLWQPGPAGNEIVQTNGGACLDVHVRVSRSACCPLWGVASSAL